MTERKQLNKKNREDDEELNESCDESLVKDKQDLASTYIIKYIRNKKECEQKCPETNTIKEKVCLFKINFKLIKNENIRNSDNNKYYFYIKFHEIAALYFDEVYEKIYTIEDFHKENKYFNVFENVEEVKILLDDLIRGNTRNSEKIFIDFNNNNLRFHIKMIYFNKKSEIIINVPKKELNTEDKVLMLPEFLKEIHQKMSHLEEENKKLKETNKKNSKGYHPEIKLMGSKYKGIKLRSIQEKLNYDFYSFRSANQETPLSEVRKYTFANKSTGKYDQIKKNFKVEKSYNYINKNDSFF